MDSLKFSIDELEEILKRERPHLILIDQELQKMPNGVVSLDIRSHNGKVTDIVFKKVTRIML